MTIVDQTKSSNLYKLNVRPKVRQAKNVAIRAAASIRALVTPTSINLKDELEKNARRAAARRAVDNLLR